jgi:glutamate dehydrogenase
MPHEISPKLRKTVDKIKSFAKSKTLSEFIDRLYCSVSYDDLSSFDFKGLYDVGTSTFELLKNKKNDGHAINYYRQSADGEYAVIEIVSKDMPFLVDSITNEFKLRQIDINLICHDMFVVKRDKKGNFESFDKDGSKEYVIQIHIPNRFHDEFAKHLTHRIDEILECIDYSVQDWRAMTSKMQEASDILASLPHKDKNSSIKDESVGFLDWLIANHLVFLGAVQCTYKNGKLLVDDKSKMGVLRSHLYNVTEIPYEREFLEDDFVIIRKWDTRSVVHRTAHMDVVLVKKYDAKGEPCGADVFFGLFTSTVYYQSVRNIPLMREKVNRVIDMYGYPETSHNCKELTTALESFPRGELLQMSVDELYYTATGIVSLSLIPRVKVFLRKDRAEKFVSCIIFIPEKKFSTETRVLIEGIVCHKLQGVVSKRYIQIGESSLTRLQLIVKLAGAKVLPNVAEEIEAEIVKAVSNWSDELYHALQKRYSKKVATTYYSKYSEAFGIKYKAVNTGSKAVHDIKYIEQAIETNKVTFDMYVRDHEDKGSNAEKLHLKIYSPAHELALSSTLPMIENMGLRAIDVEMYDVLVNSDENKHHIYLYHFHLAPKGNHAPITDEVCNKAKDALVHVWDKKIDDDAFNALIIACNMDYTYVNIVRSYVSYLKQTKYSLSQEYTIQVLLDYPLITKKLISLFCTMFDPMLAQKDRKKIRVYYY